MAFNVQDYHDFVQLLAEHPEWRSELRRLVLSDELLELPEIVRELIRTQQKTEEQIGSLAEAQRRTEGRLEVLTQQVGSLAEAQQRTEGRLEALTQQVGSLAEAQRRTEGRFDSLVEAQQRIETQLEALTRQVEALAHHVLILADGQKRLVDMTGDMKGQLLEMTYRQHAAGYFGRWLRRVRVVAPETLEETLEAALSHEELLEVLRLDLLIRGRRRDRPTASEVWLAVEVATVLNEADVARAGRRAALLRQAGYPALPVAAGENITLSAEDSARTQKVVVVQNGRGFLWEEALATWLAES